MKQKLKVNINIYALNMKYRKHRKSKVFYMQKNIDIVQCIYTKYRFFIQKNIDTFITTQGG